MKQIETKKYLEVLSDRYGIPIESFDSFKVYQPNSRYISFCPKDHNPPDGIPLESTGVYLMKTRISHPKLTTTAVQILGKYAQKNIVHLKKEQVEAYFLRKPVEISIEQMVNVKGNGYVIAKYMNHSIGIAVVDQEFGKVYLKSLFPKNWT